MFLVELHFFFLVDYRGEMRDRRKVVAWFGDTIKVPLESVHNSGTA